MSQEKTIREAMGGVLPKLNKFQSVANSTKFGVSLLELDEHLIPIQDKLLNIIDGLSLKEVEKLFSFTKHGLENQPIKTN